MDFPDYNSPPAPPQPKPKTKPKAKLTHPCPWQGCTRMFSCPHNVKQHIREKHTGEKPYVCSHCGTGFARPYTLYRHLEGKHGIKQAGPGRGRGGGLARVGAGVVKKRGRVGGMGDVGEVEDEEVALHDEHLSSENASAYEVGNPSSPDDSSAYEVNNFTPMPTTCGSCTATFGNREALLTHQHDAHTEPYSCACTCMVCLSRFSTADTVDGGGVHVSEKGAAAMRDLMADDLFSAHKGMDLDPPAPTPSNAQPQSEQDRADAFFAATGMTEEQFTWNMPEKVAARARAREERERNVRVSGEGWDLAQAAQGADVDAVDAWLRSADEVFWGWDDGGGGTGWRV